jgi:outer membrane protein
MKNVSIVFNVVLLALVGILFFLYLSLKKAISGNDGGNTKVTLTAGMQKPVRVGYVNADSINTNYALMQDFKKEMQAKQSVLQNEYDTKGRAFQSEYADLQQRSQAGTISQIDADKIQKDLVQKKSVIDNIQANLDQLAREAQEKNQKIENLVEKYVSLYNKKAHFDYVLAYARGTNVLYANDSLDITRQVVMGLNQQYKDSLQKSAVKPQ